MLVVGNLVKGENELTLMRRSIPPREHNGRQKAGAWRQIKENGGEPPSTVRE